MDKYEKRFETYKKLPEILMFVTFGLFFIWAIIDVTTFSYSWYSTYYGVFRLSSWVPEILIWFAIGAVQGIIVRFFTGVAISAKVLQTEYLVKISGALEDGEDKDSALAPSKKDRIAILESLKDKGFITEQEFQSRKAEIERT